MKKITVTLALIFALSGQVFGQGAENILSNLSKSENVDKLSIGSFGMFFIKLAGGIDGVKDLKGVKSFELLTLSDECSAKQKKEIRNQLKNLKDDQIYATLMLIKDGEDHVRLMIKKEKDTIKELLLVVLEGEEGDVVVMRLKGKFKESDLENLIAKYNKGDGR